MNNRLEGCAPLTIWPTVAEALPKPTGLLELEFRDELFYARKAASAGGPVGFFYADLPH